MLLFSENVLIVDNIDNDNICCNLDESIMAQNLLKNVQIVQNKLNDDKNHYTNSVV